MLNLLLQHQVQKHGHEPREREPRFADQGDGVVEARQRPVVARVGENVFEPVGHERGAEAEGQRRGEDEPVAPGEGHGGDDADAGDADGGEEEGRHAAQDGRRDGDEGGGEFGEDAHDEQEEAAGVAGLAVGASRQGDDAVVLREGGERGDGQEAGEEAVDAVGEDAALDAGVEEFAFDLEAGDFAGGGDVADGFHHEDDVDGQQG